MSSGCDWIEILDIRAIHEAQIARHGGTDGVCDQGLIESALARPRNLAAYGDPDVADLVTAYGFGIARDHGFVAGDKRTAWVVASLFLADNGCGLVFDQAVGYRFMMSDADGTLEEASIAIWFRERIRHHASGQNHLMNG
jgi:death on curing protein